MAETEDVFELDGDKLEDVLSAFQLPGPLLNRLLRVSKTVGLCLFPFPFPSEHDTRWNTPLFRSQNYAETLRAASVLLATYLYHRLIFWWSQLPDFRIVDHISVVLTLTQLLPRDRKPTRTPLPFSEHLALSARTVHIPPSLPVMAKNQT